MSKIYYDGAFPPLKDFRTEVPSDMVAHGFVYSSAEDIIRLALIKANIQPDLNTFTTQEKDGISVLNHWKVLPTI